MSNQLILVADSDPKNLLILKENLEASGFSVITSSDGTRAWEEIQANTPQLVLTEVTLPELNGIQLLEKMQADPNTSFIPLVFLTNQRDVQQRVRGFQAGAKDYLVKPLHVKEVIAHIRMVLRRTAKRHIDRSKNYLKITGQLSEMSLADLIEKFSVERKSGALSLNNGNEKTGKVYFRNGNVINASCSSLTPENAVYQMLTWDRGFFNMVFKNVDDIADAISISNFGLLMEGAKRIDRTEDYIQKFPSPKSIFVLSDSFKSIIAKRKLPKDVHYFISLIDGKRDIGKIVEDSHYQSAVSLERVHRLFEQGFIIAVDGEQEQAESVDTQPEVVAEVASPPTVKEKITPPKAADETPPVISKPKETFHIPQIPKSIHFIEEEKAEAPQEDLEEEEPIKLAEPEQIKVAPIGRQKPEEQKKETIPEPVEEVNDQPAASEEETTAPMIEDQPEEEKAESSSVPEVESGLPEETPEESPIEEESPAETNQFPEFEPEPELETEPAPTAAQDQPPLDEPQPETVADGDREKSLHTIRQAPIFNKEAFIKKQIREPHKSTWKTISTSRESIDENGSSNKFELREGKDQLLIIGLDEDILDEAMDLFTKNNFQTKKIEAIGSIPVHFGRIAEDNYKAIRLFGLYPEKSFSMFIAAQKSKFIGTIFIIDCSTDQHCEYAGYLIHNVAQSFHLPFMVAAANIEKGKGITIDVIRHKLSLAQNIPVLIWDGDSVDSSVKNLLSHIEIDAISSDESGPVKAVVEKISA
ncbi:MAG: response regulator [candidate division KSB1 bacterium]|jgi:DNA-binding response OmpR family regulator/signal recognition particle receptor subunit beta|nr:response regulator [candidate division KSB1 bacterium]